MKVKFGECNGCGFNKPINSKGLCPDCVYLKNHGETKLEAQIRKKKEKPVKIYKVKRKPIKRAKRKPIKYKKKTTGEYAVFLEIWAEREHRCVNCKMNLDRFVDDETGNPSASIFSHIKTKGSRGDLRLLKSNIELNCPDCHHAHEHVGDHAYNKRKDLYNDR